jgi:hypothetical protein
MMISIPLESVLDWWDFSSSMVSITDLFPPNEEVI